MGPFPFVKFTLLMGLLMTYSFVSLGRCASWLLLLFSDQRALQQSAPPAFVQNAVLLWQRPMLVFRSGHRSRNVPNQIHRYESTRVLMSVVEQWIRQWFVLTVKFSLKNHTECGVRGEVLRLEGALGDRFVQPPAAQSRPSDGRLLRTPRRVGWADVSKGFISC